MQQKVKLFRNLLAVQSLGKPGKKNSDSIFVETEDTHNVGIIKLVGETLQGKFSVGQKIYFGNEREKIRIGAEEVMIMKEDNVYGTTVADNDDDPVQI